MTPEDVEIKNERLKYLRQHFSGHYDTALPQQWSEDFRKRTGLWPVGHMVWLYDEESRIFGRPYALTWTGQVALAEDDPHL